MKMIILDRDGVINHDSPAFIKSPAEWLPIPGSLEAIARLNQAGYRVVVASNQSGIARELFDMNILNAARSTRSSFARTRRSTTATAASRRPACSRRSPSASRSA
jgi:D-glycero-D-manno-heptose 1,7-bisphosphate phosphatase